eukprot:11226350-Lingulodinium_polyedra.AAC.1
MIAQLVCTPWGPRASLAPQQPAPKSRYLTRGILGRSGRAAGCPACEERGGLRAAECRRRLEGLLETEELAKAVAAA